MIRRVCFELLCGLVAVGIGAAVVFADDRAAAPCSDGAIFDASPARCPFTFRYGMPPGVFCVYDGVVTGTDGEACVERMLMIWTRLAGQFAPEQNDDVVNWSDVYFGFDGFPELVLRADGDAASARRAPMLDYTLGSRETRVALRGTVEIRFASTGGSEGTEVLSLRVSQPVAASPACAFTSFDGIFVGVMEVPAEQHRTTYGNPHS